MPLYEGNSVEDAVSIGLNALNLPKEAVDIQVVSQAKKGFFGFGKKLAQVSIEPTVSEEISEAVSESVEEVLAAEGKQIIADENLTMSDRVMENLSDDEAIKALALYLTKITKSLNAPALVRIDRSDHLYTFHLESNKQGLLIGKHGKVLNALQYLSQVFVHRVAENKLSVVVNVGDYREKRQAILQRLATRTAEKVKQTGQPIFLEPMPAFERKQIHAALSEEKGIKTHSEGDEPHRYLVVELVKKYY